MNDKMSILNRAGERFEYDLQQTQAKKKKDELDEEERSKSQDLEWELKSICVNR